MGLTGEGGEPADGDRYLDVLLALARAQAAAALGERIARRAAETLEGMAGGLSGDDWTAEARIASAMLHADGARRSAEEAAREAGAAATVLAATLSRTADLVRLQKEAAAGLPPDW